MSDYYSEREKLRNFCSNDATFKAADQALFFSKVKAELKRSKLKVERFTYYTQRHKNDDIYDLAGSIPWQRNTKRYKKELDLFDLWLEELLDCYNENYISRDCDTLLTRWEIDLVNYTLSYTYLEFEMAQINTEKFVGWVIEIPVCFKQTPILISNNLWQTKAYIPLFKYQDPVKAWTIVEADLTRSLEKFKVVPIWYELQADVSYLPKWNLNLQLPLRSSGQWLEDRYQGMAEDESPYVNFIFKAQC